MDRGWPDGLVASSVGNRRLTQPGGREERLAARAGRQWGVVRRAHLFADGFDEAAIRRRVANGRLVARYRGVYVVGHAPLPPEGEDLAAVYAVGEDAILSELSGAVRMGMLRFPPACRDVTTATRGRRAPIPGVALHRTRRLPASDVTVHRGIPIATVPRIMLDLAGRADVSDRALESAAAQAERDGRFHRATQLATAQRSVGWRGGARLRAILQAGPELLLSDEEHAARALLRRAGLPAPQANADVRTAIGTLMCDLWWPDFGYVLEVHGGQHGRFLNASRDIDRDGAHRRAGRRVDAVTARQVREDPAAVIALAVAGLRASGWAG
jgi:very-short-patch-repair endonuclease